MDAAQHYLVSFEEVSASVGGFDISSIVELHLVAVANDIPQVTLLVDAGHSSGDGSQTAADAMTLGNAKDVFETCRNLVKTDGATLSLSLTARASGDGGEDVQRLSLSGWLLTDVSLSPVQESGVCTVALTFQHPLCKANLGGAVPGLLASPPALEELGGNNPLEIFLEALQLYGESIARLVPRPTTVLGASDTGAVRDCLLRHLMKAKESLSSALTWKGGGLPASSYLAEWEHFLRAGLSVYAMPSGGTSVFQRFAKGLVPECSLAIGGDYTASKLDVGPFTPWASADMTIRDRDIISLQFPQNDPSPLSGVHLVSAETDDSIPCSYGVLNGQKRIKPAEIYYLPESEMNAPYLYGPIQQFQEPGWISCMDRYAANGTSYRRADTTGAGDGTFNTASTVPRGGKLSWGGSSGSQSQIDYSTAMLACAKAYFETSLMKDWSFTVNCRLLFSSGGILCPGKVLGVTSGSGNVLGGYIAAVTHTVSIANRSAHTSVVCTHPRFGSLPPAISSSANALYS